MYYDTWLGGQYTFKIIELHKKYGPIIRISPLELHISDPVCPVQTVQSKLDLPIAVTDAWAGLP